MTGPFEQTTLPLYATADKTFEQYVVGANGAAVDGLRAWIDGTGPHCVLLWGGGAVGKSHLIQASLRALDQRGCSTMYVPLKLLAAHGPEVLAELDTVEAVGVDDLDVVIGDTGWETALFNVFNQTLSANTRLLISAQHNPRTLAYTLPDLRSRLSSGLIFQLFDLDDAGKQTLLQRLAAARGVELAEPVAAYILSHYDRNVGKLHDLFERIDAASLSSGRRITIPFVREFL